MTFSQNDRVIVTDLKTGEQHAGKIVGAVGVEREPGIGYIDKWLVQYDDGTRVRVGRGFVRHESDNLRIEGEASS